MPRSEGVTNAPANAVGAFGVPVGSHEEAVVQRELIRSMRLRARTMSWVLGFAAANVVVVTLLLPLMGVDLIPPGMHPGAAVGLVLALWIPEILLLVLHRHGGPRWASDPIVEALVGFVQVTAVSAFLVSTSSALDPPILVLMGPVAWLYFPLIAISILTLRPLIVLLTGLVASLQLAVLAFTLLPEEVAYDPRTMAALMTPSLHLQKVFILLLTTAVAGAVAFDLRRRLRRIARGAREREELVSIFGQHTAPEVVETLLAGSGRVTPERREIAILFLDIRGFTTSSERTAPEEVVARLDRFFDLVLPRVVANGGIVHQLLGDGFMAIFGAPVKHDDDARRAIQTALEIHELLPVAAADGRIEATDVVMGVHFGEVVVGPVGAADHKEYKATGDAVNVAARLESMAKEVDAAVLSSRAAVEAAGMQVEVMRDLGEVPIRGRVKPLRVLQLR